MPGNCSHLFSRESATYYPLVSFEYISMGTLYVLTSTSLVIIGSCFIYKLLSKSKKPLPPGPKAKPLVGNLWDLPPKGSPEWLHWFRHKELYGGCRHRIDFKMSLIIPPNRPDQFRDGHGTDHHYPQ